MKNQDRKLENRIILSMLNFFCGVNIYSYMLFLLILMQKSIFDHGLKGIRFNLNLENMHDKSKHVDKFDLKINSYTLNKKI